MAALRDVHLPELVELVSLTVADLDPLLAEEIETWQQRFDWDFRPSADLLRRFLHMRSLYGYALRGGRSVLGYAYHVCEGRKGLIGDFYVGRQYSNNATEMMLLGAAVQGLMLAPGVHRIECQLLMLNAPSNVQMPFQQYLRRHDRYFMVMDTKLVPDLPPRQTRVKVAFEAWAEKFKEDAAHVVTGAYRGHVDSDINDQYRTIPGARHFLMNIIQYPGCGKFSAQASVVAIDDNTGRVCGMCLSSLVSEKAGHITQLCVLPGMRGAQLGSELLRLALVALTKMGCTSVSLTVTCSNVDAIRLYESFGFKTLSTFPALVWEGF
jgi:ribosomal protein S18 acetylase RimI-like enzyme